MRIATWNVNSLRVRLPHVLDWMGAHRPDVLALQETKLPDDAFPVDAIREAGYEAAFAGQPTYNGVAILSREPPHDVLTTLPEVDDAQRRTVVATVAGVRVINLYVPNGQAVGSDKYAYKLDWVERVTAFVRSELESYERVVVVGDFNVAPEPRDVHDPDLWEGQVLFSVPEREAFARLLETGLCDTFRLFDQEAGTFSWWDYRMQAFRRNRGLRIDHVLATGSLCRACRACYVDKEPRALQRPSDHAPVVAEFDIKPRDTRRPR